jgi:hypothetical protein
MHSSPLFENRFGAVHADRIILNSYDLGEGEPKGESLDLAAVKKIGRRAEHPRAAVIDPSGRWGHGRFFLIGLLMLGVCGVVFGAWHWSKTRWPAFDAIGQTLPLFVGAAAGVLIGTLFYPYRVVVTLPDRKLQSTRLGSLQEARAFVAAARGALAKARGSL